MGRAAGKLPDNRKGSNALTYAIGDAVKSACQRRWQCGILLSSPVAAEFPAGHEAKREASETGVRFANSFLRNLETLFGVKTRRGRTRSSIWWTT
jgi:hypothetical protein